MNTLVIHIHTIATLMMTGLIWFVQVVHYPLFLKVEPRAFPEYERRHQQRTTIIVAPLMIAELLTAAAIALAPPPGVARPLAAFSLALVLLLWLLTALVQVPIHRRLVDGFDERLIRRLVKTNWARTLLWSARALLAISIAHQA